MDRFWKKPLQLYAKQPGKKLIDDTMTDDDDFSTCLDLQASAGASAL